MAAKKSSADTSGAFNNLASNFGSYKLISMPEGSDGNVGVRNPSGVFLNLWAVWHNRIGYIIASFTTTLISEPEYPSLAWPNYMKSSSVSEFGVLPSLILNMVILPWTSGRGM